MSELEEIRVIRTRLLRRGMGTEDDPVRAIEQYWLPDGTLLCEFDPGDAQRPNGPARGRSLR